MPLQRRIPKRGFKNFGRVEYQAVNVRDLSRVEPGPVTPEILKDHGLIRSLKKPVKVLGSGEVESAFEISAHAFSATARSKIEGAGGTVTILNASAAQGASAENADEEATLESEEVTANAEEVAAEAGAVAAVAEEVTENEETPAPEGDEASEAEDEKA
jgi:ribosomal protein L18E